MQTTKNTQFNIKFVSLYRNLSTCQLSQYEISERKANYAADILALYDIVCPGLTKERGLTLFELYSASFQMIKLRASGVMNGGVKSNNVSKQEAGRYCNS